MCDEREREREHKRGKEASENSAGIHAPAAMKKNDEKVKQEIHTQKVTHTHTQAESGMSPVNDANCCTSIYANSGSGASGASPHSSSTVLIIILYQS